MPVFSYKNSAWGRRLRPEIVVSGVGDHVLRPNTGFGMDLVHNPSPVAADGPEKPAGQKEAKKDLI